MKNIQVFFGIIILLSLTNAQYFAWFETSSKLLPITEVQTAINSIKNFTLSNEQFSRGFRDYTNITNINVNSIPLILTYLSDLIVNGTTLNFTNNKDKLSFNVSFDFVDQGLMYEAVGTGIASYKSISFTYAKTYQNQSAPNILCYFEVELGDPTISISDDEEDTSANTYINQYFTTDFKQALETIYSTNLQNVCQSLNTVQWPAQYTFNISNTEVLSLNNTYYIINFTQNGSVFGIDGSVAELLATPNIDISSFVPSSGKLQYVITTEAIKGIAKQAWSIGYFNWTLNNTNFPISTFDYTISDLANLVPSVAYQFSPSQIFSMHCQYNQINDVLFNNNTQLVYFNINATCWAVSPSNSTQNLFLTNFTFMTGAKPVFKNGKLNFKIANVNLQPNLITVEPELNDSQTNYFNYYLLSGLNSLVNSYLQIGANSNLPDVNIITASVKITAQYIYFLSN